MDTDTDSTEDEGNVTSSESEWEEVPVDKDREEVEYMKGQLELASDVSAKVSSDSGPKSEVRVDDKPIRIVVPNGTGNKRRKKGSDVIGHCIVREINKCKKEVFKDMHRVGLVCLLARGIQYNKILRDERILGTALSLLPSERAYPPKHLDVTYMEKFLGWFKRSVSLKTGPVENEDHEVIQNPAPITLEKELLAQMTTRTVSTYPFLVFIFVAILRSLGIHVRLVWNLQPPPIKPEPKDLMKLLKPEEMELGSKSKEVLLPSSSKSTSSGSKSKPRKKRKSNVDNPVKNCTNVTTTLSSSAQTRKRTQKPSSSKKTKVGTDSDSDSDNFSKSPTPSPDRKRRKRAASSSRSRCRRRQNAKPSKTKPVLKTHGKNLKSETSTSSSTSTGPVSKSTSGELSSPRKKVQVNFWAEVFLEEEEQWIAVDIVDQKILSEDTIKAKATQPICYTLAFTNSGHVKDVTIRYSDQWWTEVTKLRDDSWWITTLKPYRGRRSVQDRVEDEALAKRLEVLEIPKTVAAFKNHPRFVLRRHLLKFEAIYPEDVMPSGSMRSELVYPRSAVSTLYGREQWLRQAQVVRLGEKPYKIVKARPKFNKVLGTSEDPLPLELFGSWQVSPFQPEVAVDGKIPRNPFGNVELFQPQMLPVGTVHLQLMGLNKIGQKLNLDCVPAVVGFEFHAGGCHPKFDGFVVCEEFKEIFIDAWTQEQSESTKRTEEKRVQKVYQRWAKLCQGLLIRAKLEKKYKYDFSFTKIKG